MAIVKFSNFKDFTASTNASKQSLNMARDLALLNEPVELWGTCMQQYNVRFWIRDPHTGFVKQMEYIWYSNSDRKDEHAKASKAVQRLFGVLEDDIIRVEYC